MLWIAPLIVAAVGLLIAVAAIVLAKRSVSEARQQEQQLNQRIETLENELSAMMDGAFGVANQLQKVESNLKSTVQQQEQLQQRDMGNLPYNDAVRRVSKGADVDELVEHCGLSRSEAELVTMLHKKSTAQGQSAQEQSAQAQSTETEIQSATPQRAVEDQTSGQAPVSDEPQTQEPRATADFGVAPAAETEVEETLAPDELGVSQDQQEPLFSGDLGGDDFQQALERAREFQTQPTTSDEEQANREPTTPAKPQNKIDE